MRIPIARAESPDYPCGHCEPCEWLPASFVLSVRNMTEEQMDIVAAARIVVVLKFRNGEGGYSRPDSPGDPWYNPEEWDDQGNYYGPPKKMMPVPVSKVTDVTNDTPEIPDWAEPDFLEAVASQLSQGKSIAEIAADLDITKAKVQRLKAKLKLSD